MGDETFLDIRLRHRFCASLEAAGQQAIREAANTGGVVLRVRSLRIDPKAVVIAGLIPSTALVFDSSLAMPGVLHPRSIGTFHLTWNTLLHATAADDIGYLVLQTPVITGINVSPPDEDDSHWGALPIERLYHTLPPGCIGANCCVRCNRPISDQRLKAIPGVRFCTVCQQQRR